MDNKEGSELFSQFNGMVMPTLVFTNNKGEEIDRIIGFLPPDEYQAKVNDIVGNVNTLSACLHKYNNGDNSPENLFTIANKYNDRNESENALKFYKELLTTHDNLDISMSEKANFEIAYEAFKNGDLAPFDTFIENNPQSSMAQRALMSMVRYYKGQDNQVSELGVFSRALKMYPNDPQMLNAYAWRMTELELNLEDALDKSRLAVKLATDEDHKAQILDTEAEVLYKLKRWDDAILVIEKALRIDPSNDYFIEQKEKFVNAKKEARQHVPA